jgi:long-subunit fatty acid transport protein
MRQILSILVIFVMIISAGSAFGFVSEVKIDTVFYSTIQNFFFSPMQLTDYNFLGAGARARSMGGAFLAISDDPTAASWNPAGLSLLDKAQMDLSFDSYMDRGENTTSGLDLSFSEKLEYDKNRISSASVVIPFKIRDKELVGSVLYQVISNIYQENKYVLVNDTLITQTGYPMFITNRQDIVEEKVTGSLDAITLALGSQIFGSFSLGVGVNIYRGGFTSNVNLSYPKSIVTSINTRIDTTIAADTTIDTVVTAVNIYEHFHPTIESDYSGYNFTIGGMYQMDKLNLAAVVKTPFILREKNDFRYLSDILYGGVTYESGVMSTTTEGEADREWKIPIMVGFGASYRLPSLTLAADLEFRNYSKSEVTYHKKVLDPNSEEVTADLEWRNLTQFRIGGEYMLHTRFGDIPIRAGFRNDPKLFTDQYDSMDVFIEEYERGQHIEGYNDLYPQYIKSKPGVEVGSWVNGNVFSFGTGIAWSQIKLDVTFEFATYDDVQRKVFTEIAAFDPGERRISYVLWEPKEFSQKISNKYNRIMVSFTGFF